MFFPEGQSLLEFEKVKKGTVDTEFHEKTLLGIVYPAIVSGANAKGALIRHSRFALGLDCGHNPRYRLATGPVHSKNFKAFPEQNDNTLSR